MTRLSSIPPFRLLTVALALEATACAPQASGEPASSPAHGAAEGAPASTTLSGSEPPVAGAEPPAEPGQPFAVPRELPSAPLERRVIANDLSNPRGLLAREDGSLLVSEAGTGDPADPNTGALLSLRDANGDGDYDDEGERTRLLGGQPSKNIVQIVQRDEVFGMADIAQGGGSILATIAFFGGPSTVFRVDGQSVDQWATIHGNLNDIAYDDQRRQWFAVSSSSDEVLKIYPDGRGDRLVKLPPLPQGQDPVPGYVRFDPTSHTLLVSLFSGSTRGEAGGDGTDIVSRAGAIIRVDPDTGKTSPFITGLTAPTDFLIEPDGMVYVLEFCDAFLEPIRRREDFAKKPRHGGFRRFSGRLLRVDPAGGAAVVVAEHLDAPSNLTRKGTDLLVSQGMGTPGRPIPGPDGKPTQLRGFIEALRSR